MRVSPFDSLADWPVGTVAAAIDDGSGPRRHGPTQQMFPLASITKLLTALAALVAHEEGTLPLDEPIVETPDLNVLMAQSDRSSAGNGSDASAGGQS